MNFAPYQDSSPDAVRALSPPPAGGRRSFSPNPISTQQQQQQQPASKPISSYQHIQDDDYNDTSAAWGSSQGDGLTSSSANDVERGFGGGGGGGREEHINAFETSLPIRLDYEAAMVYLILPPVAGVVVLLLEHKSDYVRYHAWQSSLLFSAIFVVHLVFSWISWLSWLIFIGDIALMLFLARQAYIDADTLDRYMVPFFGPLASRILDSE